MSHNKGRNVTALMQRDASILLVIDIQEKLAPAIHGAAGVVASAEKMLKAAGTLGVPVLASEQYTKGLGASVPALLQHLDDTQRIEKTHFGCLDEPGFAQHLEATGRSQVVVCGTETHVCVLQTALQLLAAGYAVFVVADAVGSRTPENRRLGLDRMTGAGAQVVSTEMVVFEWLGRAGTDEFKTLLPLIK